MQVHYNRVMQQHTIIITPGSSSPPVVQVLFKPLGPGAGLIRQPVWASVTHIVNRAAFRSEIDGRVRYFDMIAGQELNTAPSDRRWCIDEHTCVYLRGMALAGLLP